MYADDHQLYVSDNSINAVEEKLNANGEIASQWYKNNFLQGNKDKYNSMLLSSVNNEAINVHIDGQDISNCKNLKLLGVAIDSDLMFRSHIQDICINTNKKIGVL